MRLTFNSHGSGGLGQLLHYATYDEEAGARPEAEAVSVRPRRPRIAESREATTTYVPSRYETSRFDGKSLAIVAAIHGAVAALLLTASVVAPLKPPPPVLHTFDIQPPQPPSPPPPEPVETVVEQPLTMPRPLIRLQSSQAPIVPIADAPPPVAVMPVAAAVVAESAPAAAPAPAPVTPPDFNAAQLNNPAPAYPYLARKAREQGVVLLRVLVTANGRAGEVKLEETSGSRRLDDAAMATVRKWRFVPAQQAGKTIAAWVIVPITFTLA